MNMKIRLLKKMSLFMVLVISILTFQPTIASKADEMVLPVMFDTYVDELDPGGNFNDSPLPLQLGASPNGFNCLFLFDAEGFAGTTISSAILTIYILNAPGPCEADVLEIVDSWDPMTVTWNTQPAYAPRAPFSIPPGASYPLVVEDITPIFVAWAEGSPNYGLAIWSMIGTAEIASIESGPPGAEAFITVTYTIPEIAQFLLPVLIASVIVIGLKTSKKQK